MMREIVESLLAAGVREYVVCGGARNAGLVAAIVSANEALEEVQVWRHFEERGAGFFALGRAQALGEPVAVVVTSGTAVSELLPAVTEGYYSGGRLLVVSADRPAGFRGSGAPQAVEQVGVFGEMVAACHDIEADSVGAGREVAAALQSWEQRSPLHLNICCGEEEVSGDDLRWPEVGVWAEPTVPLKTGRLAAYLREDVWKGLVVMLGGLPVEDREEVLHFCKALAVPVVADATSGLRELLGKQYLSDADAVLRANPPGKVLRLGAVPVGRFWRDLEELPDVDVMSVSALPFPGLARESELVVGGVARVLRTLGEVDAVGDATDLLVGTSRSAARIDEEIEAHPESEAAMVRTLSVMATTGESVMLGNSLPIRQWGRYAQRAVPYDEVRAMRGANGIDGQISWWLGASAGEGESWAVLGDLTTLYDCAGLAFAKQTGGKRVLAVLNNGGGKIFAKLPRLDGLNDRQREAIEQPQEVEFAGLAQLWKCDYVRVATQDDFDQLDELGEGLTLVEVVVESAS